MFVKRAKEDHEGSEVREGVSSARRRELGRRLRRRPSERSAEVARQPTACPPKSGKRHSHRRAKATAEIPRAVVIGRRRASFHRLRTSLHCRRRARDVRMRGGKSLPHPRTANARDYANVNRRGRRNGHARDGAGVRASGRERTPTPAWLSDRQPASSRQCNESTTSAL